MSVLRGSGESFARGAISRGGVRFIGNTKRMQRIVRGVRQGRSVYGNTEGANSHEVRHLWFLWGQKVRTI